MSGTCTRCGGAVPGGAATCPSCGQDVRAADRRVVPRRALMTELATKAMDLSDTFNLTFEGKYVGLELELGKPGMSTGGGKQAVQHITLHTAGGASLVVGSVDTAAKRAELRAHDRLDHLHRQRFGTGLPLGAADWAGFADKATRFLEDEGLAVEREPEGGARALVRDAGVVVPERVPSRGVPLWLAVALALALAAAAVAVTVLWLGRTAPPALVPSPPPGTPPAAP